MCRRSLLLNHQTPTLRGHKTTWLYHLPESRQITLRCYINTQWLTYTETLSGNGVITNATRCSVSTSQMHTLSELHKTSGATLHTPHLYVPEKIIVTDHETQILEKLSPELIQQLDGIKSRVMASPRNLDVDNIVHVHHVSLQQERQSYWNLIVIATMHDYVHGNPLLLLTLSHIPSNITLLSYTQTPKTSHVTSSNPITIHTQPRNKRSNQHWLAEERDFHNVFVTTSHLEGIILNASRRSNCKKQLPAFSPVRDDRNSDDTSEFWDEITPTKDVVQSKMNLTTH